MRNVLTTENQEKLFAVELTASGLGKLQPATACRDCLFFPYNFLKTLRLEADIAIHFYCDDNNFQRVWNDPGRLVKQVESKGIKQVVMPDFSTFSDMPFPLRLYNIYRNTFLGAFWQFYGVNVLPSATFTEGYYDYSYLPQTGDVCWGLPKGNDPENLALFHEAEKELRRQRPNLNIVTFGRNGDIQDSFYKQFRERTNGNKVSQTVDGY